MGLCDVCKVFEGVDRHKGGGAGSSVFLDIKLNCGFDDAAAGGIIRFFFLNDFEANSVKAQSKLH